MITRFENYLRNIKGYSERTCSEYAKDLKAFALWIKAHKVGARWSTLTRQDIDDYITYKSKQYVTRSYPNSRRKRICKV